MLSQLATRVAPRLVWTWRIKSWGIDPGEPESALLPTLASKSRLSIDVGAADGKYTAMLVPLSRRVVAFEPTPGALATLRTVFSATPIVVIEPVALSNESGVTTMRFVPDHFWRSTLERGNALKYAAGVSELSVTMRRLDDYDFQGVGFIKIDVEGHEAAVLQGAARTIESSRPNVMIEVEEQHCAGAFAGISGYFAARSYDGFFLLDGVVMPLSKFDLGIHQDLASLNERGERRPGRHYINNFIFVPAERSARWRQTCGGVDLRAPG